MRSASAVVSAFRVTARFTVPPPVPMLLGMLTVAGTLMSSVASLAVMARVPVDSTSTAATFRLKAVTTSSETVMEAFMLVAVSGSTGLAARVWLVKRTWRNRLASRVMVSSFLVVSTFQPSGRVHGLAAGHRVMVEVEVSFCPAILSIKKLFSEELAARTGAGFGRSNLSFSWEEDRLSVMSVGVLMAPAALAAVTVALKSTFGATLKALGAKPINPSLSLMVRV